MHALITQQGRIILILHLTLPILEKFLNCFFGFTYFSETKLFLWCCNVNKPLEQ